MTEPATTQQKQDKPAFQITGCFRVRVKDNAAKHALMTQVKFHGSHLRNLVLILRKQLYEAQETDPDVKPTLAAFSSPAILRDTVYGRAGKKQAEKMLAIREHFAGNELFENLCTHARTHFDAKSFMSVLGNIKASFEQFYTNMERFKASPGSYTAVMGNDGAPRPPRAKRINQINKASLLVDGEKWDFKKLQVEKNGFVVTHNVLSIKLAAQGRILVPVNPTKFPVPAGHELRSLNINISNDAVYLNFTYGKFVSESAGAANPTETAPTERPTKWAGIDVGLNNVLSVFVGDATTSSLLLCGKKYKHYNVRFNKHLSDMNEQIAGCVTEWKTIKDNLKVPLSYSETGHQLIATRTHMRECRNRFFDAEFDKLSARIVNYFVQADVTDVSLSRNLSFLKTKQEKSNTLRSSTRQQFYHLPFGRLLNHIARKCALKNINVHDIDEAYTSKVSCLSANISAIQQMRRQQRNTPLSATDCNGRRVQRGLFRDDEFGLRYHADMNGAVNHIKMAEPAFDATPHLHNPWKLCSPRRICSDQAFSHRLRNKSATSDNNHRTDAAKQGPAQNETV